MILLKKINIVRYKNELLTNLFKNNIICLKTVKKNYIYIDHKDEILNEKKLIEKYDNFSIYLFISKS